MTVLTDKPEVGRTDAALLVKELIEIYTTVTTFVLHYKCLLKQYMGIMFMWEYM